MLNTDVYTACDCRLCTLSGFACVASVRIVMLLCFCHRRRSTTWYSNTASIQPIRFFRSESRCWHSIGELHRFVVDRGWCFWLRRRDSASIGNQLMLNHPNNRTHLPNARIDKIVFVVARPVWISMERPLFIQSTAHGVDNRFFIKRRPTKWFESLD